jgi:signal transduction histidine kinase
MMRIHIPHPGLPLSDQPRWLRLPRPTARLRLSVLYGTAFLACGAVVVVFAYLWYAHITHISAGGRQTVNISAQPAVHTSTHGAAHGSGQPEGVTLDQKAAEASAAAFQAQINAALHEAGNSPAVRAFLQQARSTEGQAAQWQMNIDLGELLIGCAIAMGVIAVAAGAIGWFIAGRVLRPLSTMTAAARRISASSLHERLALHGPDDELKELGDTLDGLFARLEASFDTQRRFAANASHELRTPLTRERTLLQVTLADPAATTATWEAVSRELLASNAEQEHLIEALLTLASSEAGTGERESVDLAVVTSAAVAAARPAISRRGLHVQADTKPAVLDGDPLLVQQLVTNLLDNAVRHNRPGGDIQVTTKTSGGHAVLSVANSGQVVPPAEVDRLFQPFQRLGPRLARRDGGHGLGLSIVRAIATAHAAAIGARAQPDGGLAVDVTFPAPLGPRIQERHLQGQADRDQVAGRS